MTRRILLGSIPIGGGAPVSIQSMCNTRTSDVQSTLKQIGELADSGCQIVRVSVPDEASAEALKSLTEKSPLPLIADIHFDYRLALKSMENGVSGLRVNPGNLGGEEAIAAVAKAAVKHQCVLRVGANSGSVALPVLRAMQARFAQDSARAMTEALVQSVLDYAHAFEKYGVESLKVSLKSTSVKETIDACRLFAQRSDLPQHIGITESGIPARGIIKSAVGIGTLLMEGIGDTIRVSLTADPVEEVRVALRILQACSLRESQPEIVSCPTCARTQIDVQGLAQHVETLVFQAQQRGKINLKKIAVMGCAVNGPGEARDADLALCGTNDGRALLIIKGKPAGLYSQQEALCELKKHLNAAVIK